MLTPHFLDEDDSDRRFLPGYGPPKKIPDSSGGNPPTKAPKQIRVLLVEDSSVDARLVQLSLKHVAGITFEVVIEATVTKAVERLDAGGFQLVLLDLGLPDSWGFDTFRKVRDYAEAIPIIVLTGNADEEIGIQAIHQGAQDYLLKGADAATLSRAIRYALSRHRMRRRTVRALEAAKASEANQRMLIEKNLDGIVVVDREGRVAHANPVAETLFGYPIGALIGQHFPLPVTPGATQEIDLVTFKCEVVPTELRVGAIDWNGESASLVLLRDLTEHRRAESDRHKMETARQVQQALLPKSAPNLRGFDIAGASMMADETGGDYFDYLVMPDGNLGLVVADASGHGIAAALMITAMSATLRAFSSMTSDPGEVLRRVAQTLGPNMHEGHFVTAVLGCIDPARRTLTYASAGHPSVLVIDSDGKVRVNLASLDLPIGLDPDQCFQSSSPTPLNSGDILVLMSDGILEAMRADGTMFGKARAVELIRLHRHEPAQTIVKTLMEAVRNYCVPKSPADDVTVVVAKIE